MKFFNVSGDLQGSSNVIQKEYADLGTMSLAERKVLIVVILYALGLFLEITGPPFGCKRICKRLHRSIFCCYVLFSSSGRKNKEGE